MRTSLAAFFTVVLMPGISAAQYATDDRQASRGESAAVSLAESAATVSGESASAEAPGQAARASETATQQNALRSPLPRIPVARRSRPFPLIPMYATFSTLEALDYRSTAQVLSSGAGRETNPVAGSMVTNRPVFMAAKLGATAAMVLVTEKMWKKNPIAAVVFMAAANGALAAIVAHNYSVAAAGR